MDSNLPNTQPLINFDFTAPLIRLQENEKKGVISLVAIFPHGPTPLCLNPIFTFGEGCGDMNWKFKVVSGNRFWVCGAIPLDMKEYLGPKKSEPPISLENDISAAVRTDGFFSRGKVACVLNMQNRDIEIIAKNSQRVLEIHVAGVLEKTFSLKEEKWENGLRIVVACCDGAILRVPNHIQLQCSVKPAKRREQTDNPKKK